LFFDLDSIDLPKSRKEGTEENEYDVFCQPKCFFSEARRPITYNVLRLLAVGLSKHQLSPTTNVYLKILNLISERK
jgi:hypothetical protein